MIADMIDNKKVLLKIEDITNTISSQKSFNDYGWWIGSFNVLCKYDAKYKI